MYLPSRFFCFVSVAYFWLIHFSTLCYGAVIIMSELQCSAVCAKASLHRNHNSLFLGISCDPGSPE